MVDVVNSSLASTPLLQSNAGSRSVVSNAATENVAQPPIESVATGPQAPFVSLFISVDYDFDTAVIQVRDSDTGNVEDQFPSESRLVEIRRSQAQVELSRQRIEGQDVAPTQSRAETSPSSQQSSGGSDVITVQEITSATQGANTQQVSSQVAAATLAAGSQQSSQTTQSSVSVVT